LTTVVQGQAVTLEAAFFQYSGGPAVDVTNLTVQIATVAGATIVGPTSTGIVHIATGIYTYVWATALILTPGDYVVAWVATQTSASEIVTVLSATAGPLAPVEVMYATREEVKSALDVPETSRSNMQIDREIQAASRSIEGDVLRYFYPSVSVQTFDWPDHQFAAPWRLWLDQRELTSVTQVLAAGVDITSSVMLRPDDAPLRGIPYTKLEIDLSSNSAFNAGNTFQRSISVAGTFGYCAAEHSAGTMVSAFTDLIGTTGTCTDSNLLGVGSIIRVDQERMIVTGKAMAATGQTLAATIAAQANATTVGIQSGAAVDTEVIMLDSEQMLITDIVGNNLTVIRAWNGTVLAQHTTGAAVNAPRLLTVQRGVLGTTAATHSANASINVHVVPSLVREWCIAEALNTLVQSRRGYTTIVKRSAGNNAGPGDPLDISSALDDLRRRGHTRYLRMRKRTAARLV